MRKVLHPSFRSAGGGWDTGWGNAVRPTMPILSSWHWLLYFFSHFYCQVFIHLYFILIQAQTRDFYIHLFLLHVCLCGFSNVDALRVWIKNQIRQDVWITVLRPVNQDCCQVFKPKIMKPAWQLLHACAHTLMCRVQLQSSHCDASEARLHRVGSLQSRLCSDSHVQSWRPLLPFQPSFFIHHQLWKSLNS